MRMMVRCFGCSEAFRQNEVFWVHAEEFDLLLMEMPHNSAMQDQKCCNDRDDLFAESTCAL